MKKVLLLSLFYFFVSLKSFSQLYYWSNNEKILLTSDSTQILVKHKNPLVLTTQYGAENLSDFFIRTENLKILKIKSGFSKRIIESFKNDPDVDYFIPLFQINKEPIYFTDEIILQPKKGIMINEILTLSKKRLSIKRFSYNSYLIKVEKTENVISVANSIYESGLVDWCHPNFIMKIFRAFTPNDPLFSQQYYLNNTGQLGGSAYIDINAPEAWDISLGCNNIRVAVIDDGVEDHEDLGNRVLQGFTPVNGGNGRPINGCTIGHGLNCTGIIAATNNNNLGVAGIAGNSQIVPINIFAGGETADDIAAGINWAWNPNQGNADVISNSWGYNTTANVSDAIRQAIINARTQGRVRGGVALGCVVVFASGNSNQNFSGVTFPANTDGVVTVGSMDISGVIWNYSSRGSEMDVVAPSGNLAQLVNGCIVPGGDVRTTDRMAAAGYDAGNYTNGFGGTSAACPQVAGISALILSVNPNLTENQVSSGATADCL